MSAASRLLVVEDETKLAANLKRGLGEAGFVVDHAPSAEAARAALAQGAYDAMVLDLRLPGQDGLDFLRELRAAGAALPVLILTARDATGDLVAGLDGGGDDYLTKPFAFSELTARLRALLRRRLIASQPVLAAGGVTIDTVRRQAMRNGRALELSPKELMVLECLVRHGGVPVTRDMIGEMVWGADYNALSNIVEVFINRLRQKIDFAGEPSLIVTVRGVGYLLRTEPPPSASKRGAR
ncbi:MAG TPA: response regulator transcription factor [Candidatus Binataceae bacterium]|jgi:two-component system OmpR family response regulator|nr:response regulator transcription factor [Candidatus Binataceae bacterium]